jgi:hypothetical protein
MPSEAIATAEDVGVVGGKTPYCALTCTSKYDGEAKLRAKSGPKLQLSLPFDVTTTPEQNPPFSPRNETDWLLGEKLTVIGAA